MGGAVTAHHRDGFVDLGALSVVKAGDVALDPGDQVPDPGDLLLGGGGVGTGPFIDAADGGGQPFPGAEQVLEVGLQVGQEGDVGAEVIAPGAPLTELTAMFQQFMAGFRLLALTCPRDRIG